MTEESAKPEAATGDDAKKPAEETPPPAHHEEGVAETSHTVTIGGKEVSYTDRKSTRLNSSHIQKSRMPSSA